MFTLAMPTRRRRAAGSVHGRVRRLVGAVAGLFAVALVACVLGLLGLMAGGYRPMIEQSDSMAPAMRAGDVLFVQRIATATARDGDVVTFSDAQHPGRTLTHRVVSIEPTKRGKLAFVTRGDANTGVERWTVAPDGVLGRYAFRVPGFAVRLAQSGAWRGLVVLAAITLAFDFLRRIWRRPADPVAQPTTD
jgi:signal peptidase